MIILPAIDLLDGQVVRLREGRLTDKTVYSHDPLGFARRWEEEGGSCLHVVDLNAAFTGEPKNIGIIKRLVRKLNIPVQVGGGIRSLEAATTFIDAGVARVVLGTGAVDSPILLESLVNRFGGDRIAVSVDARDGHVAIRGWTEITAINVFDFIRLVEKIGVHTIIFTDIATDGTLMGPNFAALEKILETTKCNIISSGGVANLDHIKHLAAMERLYGVVVGRALFDGTIDLAEAVAVANYHSDARGAV
ncbi:MAG: 1-(5-phosphoribosyl)-5-[(5-phosphoribosylamino)methylideneamino]imidazole-4-carboxamide isomerase [Verrucomicrobia bacterium]|jgi:phosphoribosylformimino-5-aminoimidazole carboxamide ribotide isomerase|nr:1-(5-phosphoribosyl)-5-[(5-phosphoribosylamino)methylideneamino]imidazole-4-carboxamide isomerase [Verrucomicrobiota bacterium]